MSQYSKPLPIILEDGKEYWEGCKRHEVLIQRCRDCGEVQFPHRTVCSHCFSTAVESLKASGKGTVYSFTTVYRAPIEGFESDLPYTIVIVDMDEGTRMMSRIVECEPEHVSIGMKIEVVFDDVTADVSLPMFKPVAS